MLPTTNTYSSFAAKDIAAEKQFYGQTLGIDVGELYDGGLLELRLGGDKRVLIYSKDDFVPATCARAWRSSRTRPRPACSSVAASSRPSWTGWI
jgi:hypothetical protein